MPGPQPWLRMSELCVWKGQVSTASLWQTGPESDTELKQGPMRHSMGHVVSWLGG